MAQMLFTANQAIGFDYGASCKIPSTVQARRPFRDHFDSNQRGGAKRPNKSEIKRLRDVAKHYNAQCRARGVGKRESAQVLIGS